MYGSVRIYGFWVVLNLVLLCVFAMGASLGSLWCLVVAFRWPGWSIWVPMVSHWCPYAAFFGAKMWLKQCIFVCFCLAGPSGVSLVSFVCFWLAWVAIGGPHGVPMVSYRGSFCCLCGACGDLWDPFGSLWAPMFCF